MRLIDDDIIDGKSLRRVHVALTYVAAIFTVLVVIEGVALFFLFVLRFGWVR